MTEAMTLSSISSRINKSGAVAHAVSLAAPGGGEASKTIRFWKQGMMEGDFFHNVTLCFPNLRRLGAVFRKRL